MQKIIFQKRDGAHHRVLCLGAHCDDIEIGCGGTILRLINDYEPLEFYWVVFSSNAQRAEEASVSANLFLKDVKEKRILIESFRESFLPYYAVEVKEFFERIKKEFSPDLILTHFRDDRHQDHRLISDLTWNTYRNHLIFEYEIPKYDGDFGSPNFFVNLPEPLFSQKIRYILQSYASQKAKHWFTEDTFLSIGRLRGIESCAEGRYAEAFYCRKVIL